ncbi:MAG: hypothetical protein IK990_13460 [Ruminiclostridium sp.]|nr:hypothetical protein [Ruminiclostridium sp.]
MSNQELCLLLESVLALIETGNSDRAAEVIKNGIKRIDKEYKRSEDDKND